MERFDLYRDIAERTEGDIYIGVVGPVRTGKSTFITRFMDLMVLPNMDNPSRRERAMDELPQSGSGKTIMTTQPKFVPDEAAQVIIGHANFNVRLVDCVGYLVKGALGTMEEDVPRMVRTPWFDYDIPFEQAAEIGTRKVITDHSTIGLVVTTDGSITEIPRTSYVEAEERVVKELKELGKPFVTILNSKDPEAEETKRLARSLHEKYDVPVLPLNIKDMTLDDVHELLQELLFEFPLTEVYLDVPEWVQTLSESHWLVSHLLGQIHEASASLSRVRDYRQLREAFDDSPYTNPMEVTKINLGEGCIDFRLPLKENLFYQVLGEECGCEVLGEAHLLSLMKELVSAKLEYDRVANALEAVRETGYGLVAPTQEELTLEEPEIVKQGNRFGVKLKASAPSLHIARIKQKYQIPKRAGRFKPKLYTDLSCGNFYEDIVVRILPSHSGWQDSLIFDLFCLSEYN